MKFSLFLLTVLLSFGALAEPLIVPPNTKLPINILAQKCANSCLVMDQQDWLALQAQVAELQQRAFEAGKLAERKSL